MLEEAAEKRSESLDVFPSLTSGNGEFPMLQRIFGSSGDSANAYHGTGLSWRRRKMHFAQSIMRAEQAAIDAVLEPDTEIPDVFKLPKEPGKSVRFADLQKLPTELSQQSTPHDLYKTNNIIPVKEMNHNKQHEVASGMLARGENDRPLKSLHWKALGRRHHCNGNSLKCEKCRRVLEVRKATERFEAKRAAKELLQEINCDPKAEDEVAELRGGIQRFKGDDNFCRNFSLLKPRTKTQSRNSKWAQQVLCEMPKEVYNNCPDDEFSPRVSTPMPVNEEFKIERDMPVNEESKIERDTRRSLGYVSRLKLIRERDYLDDEPDLESEEITSWDLAPRSQTDVVFTLPCVCHREFAEPRPLKPRILLFDMSSCDSDGSTNHFDSRDIVPKRESNQNCVLTITELVDTENTEWNNPPVLDEKDTEIDSECESEEELLD